MNWKSSGQVLELLGKLGLDVQDTKRTTLERVKDQHPVVPLIIRYRSIQARTKTFNEQWAKENSLTGRVHGGWQQIGAATGRMACRSPNLQNIPRDLEYRSCIVAAPGHVSVRGEQSYVRKRERDIGQ